ncbi:L,D-transpeptidase family protein [Sulfurimonas sp. HSL-1716]|uniref:L,D-transpeptidase family protein n=1 Tax=Hydrocurvibacter sulfurireducens TaxID=3131937 RepID=UPI0031F7A698
MIKVLLVLVFVNFAFAQDILTQYRLNGIDGIEQRLDQELSEKSYWDKVLSHADTKYGYFEADMDILTCNKKESSLELHVMDKNNTFHEINNYSAFTGKYSGDKMKEGDLRTPVGIYTIVKKIDKIDSFYGPLALVTSYPNLYDRYNNKDGHGIWIHGLPINKERDEFTKGCIAIGNDDIVCLDRKINYDKTLLIINDTNIKTYPSKDDLSVILANLYKWRYSWIYNDLKTYLSFYDESFKRFDGMQINDFKKYKTRIFNKNEKKSIVFTNISVIPYPNYEKNIYEISFNETYRSDSFSFSGNKKLIVQLSDTAFKILTER